MAGNSPPPPPPDMNFEWVLRFWLLLGRLVRHLEACTAIRLEGNPALITKNDSPNCVPQTLAAWLCWRHESAGNRQYVVESSLSAFAISVPWMITSYLASLCLVAHKASTECIQFSLLAAAALASSHVRHPALFLSLSQLFFARWSERERNLNLGEETSAL